MQADQPFCVKTVLPVVWWNKLQVMFTAYGLLYTDNKQSCNLQKARLVRSKAWACYTVHFSKMKKQLFYLDCIFCLSSKN